MFDFEEALREWRGTARAFSFSRGELEELESHLRSSYLAHLGHGKAPHESFALALRALGGLEQVSSEYGKVRGASWWRLLKVGWLAFAVSFFLPVAEGGVSLMEFNLGEGFLPGLQAVWVALEEGGWYAFSSLTNLLILVTMWRASDIDRVRALRSGVAMALSALFNGVLWMGAGLELLPGFFVWLGSFGLVATALLVRARELHQSSSIPTVAT